MIKDLAEAQKIAREHMKFGNWENVPPQIKQAYENGFVNGLLCKTDYYKTK